MNKIVTILYFIFSFSFACIQTGDVPARKLMPNVDPQLRPFVQDFLDSAKMYGVNVNLSEISVVFANVPAATGLPLGYIGYCDIVRKVVYIDESIARSCQPYSVQALIDHELGHCLLGRAHVDSKFPGSNIPTTLMNPTVLADIYSNNKEYYRRELFTNRRAFGSLGLITKKTISGLYK